MVFKRSWSSEITRLVALFFTLTIFGLVAGNVVVAVSFGVFVYIAWMLYNISRLDNWLSKGAKTSPPDAPGIWGEIFYHYYLIQNKNKRHKKQLAAMVKQFRATSHAMPDATVVLNKNYEIEWFNSACRKMLGLDPKHDIGLRIDSFLRHPDFIEFLRAQRFEHPVEIGSPVSSGDLLSVRLVPFGDDQLLMVVWDVTAIHRADLIRRDFVANTSHELRTPLTVLSGYLENLQESGEKELVEAWKQPIENMRKQTDRMIQIVNDMLLLSEVEQVEKTNPKDIIDVPNLILNVVDAAKELSAKEFMAVGQEFKVNVLSTLLVAGDESQLYAAFSNLIFNAVRYTQSDGLIEITWQLRNHSAYFEVLDNGPGIDAHHLPRLTERFYRVDKGRSRRSGGSGLGLAIVRHIVTRHDAELKIDSRIGRGSSFSITFPEARVQQRTLSSGITT